MTGIRQSGQPLVMDDDIITGHSAALNVDAIFEAAPTGMALVDLDGGYLRVNARLCELTGYARPELLRSTLWSLTHPDDLNAGREILRRFLHGVQKTFELERRYRRKDGSVIWVQLRGSAVPDAQGRPAAFLCHIEDISERRWAEDELVAQHAVTRLVQQVTEAANGASTLEEAVGACLGAVCSHTGWAVGQLWLPADAHRQLWVSADVRHSEGDFEALHAAASAEALPDHLGLPGAVQVARAARWATDVAALLPGPYADELRRSGLRAAFAFPVLVGSQVAAVMEFLARETFPPPPTLLRAMEQIGAQLGRVMERQQAAADQRAAQQALRAAQERFERAFDNAPIGMALISADGCFLEVNRALTELLGREASELLGSPHGTVVHPDDRDAAAMFLERAAKGELSAFTVEQRYLRPDGRERWGRLAVSTVWDASGSPGHLVAQIEDVTERRNTEERLQWQALHDALTGLANRSLLLDHLEHALNRIERRPASTALFFCDLDGFKELNDAHGHAAGDAVLRAVANRLRAAVRPSDTVARLGGDEFVVLCEDLADEDEAALIADRLCAELAQPVSLEGARWTPTSSVGVAVAADADTDPVRLLQQADAAMYRAKQAGKNRWST